MIIVAGGTSGIGKSIALDLRSKGERVLTISRKKLLDDQDHFAIDITDYESLKSTYRKINKMSEGVTALIN